MHVWLNRDYIFLQYRSTWHCIWSICSLLFDPFLCGMQAIGSELLFNVFIVNGIIWASSSPTRPMNSLFWPIVQWMGVIIEPWMEVNSLTIGPAGAPVNHSNLWIAIGITLWEGPECITLTSVSTLVQYSGQIFFINHRWSFKIAMTVHKLTLSTNFLFYRHYSTLSSMNYFIL